VLEGHDHVAGAVIALLCIISAHKAGAGARFENSYAIPTSHFLALMPFLA
jgi:hypothetical protein